MSRESRQASIPGVRTRRMTEWHNPTKDTVKIILHDEGNKRFAFIVEPGGTEMLDSSYDRAIQTIDCGREECHDKARGGYYCNAGHSGQVQAGLAPQLKRVGKNDTVIDELNVPLVEQRRLENTMIAATNAKEIQEAVAQNAAAKLQSAKAETTRGKRE